MIEFVASASTHESKADPDALLARKSKGKDSKLSYSGNLLVENPNGLIVEAEVFAASGTAERDAELVMLEQVPGGKQVTVGGDEGFDTPRTSVDMKRNWGDNGCRFWGANNQIRGRSGFFGQRAQGS